MQQALITMVWKGKPISFFKLFHLVPFHTGFFGACPTSHPRVLMKADDVFEQADGVQAWYAKVDTLLEKCFGLWFAICNG